MTAPARGLRPGCWTAGPDTAVASFRARDVVHKPVTGTLPVRSASVEVDGDGAPVRIVAELDLAGVDTGHARRDRDLRGRRFFDVQRSDVLVFTAGRVTATRDGWALDGELDLHGTRCTVVVEVERTGPTSVRATTGFDRRQLGIRVPRLMVGSQVAVSVEAELAPPA